MEEPSNAVLLEKIEAHKELSQSSFGRIDNHLTTLNHKTAKNTEWILKNKDIGDETEKLKDWVAQFKGALRFAGVIAGLISLSQIITMLKVFL